VCIRRYPISHGKIAQCLLLIQVFAVVSYRRCASYAYVKVEAADMSINQQGLSAVREALGIFTR